jgi:hypothetical protein
MIFLALAADLALAAVPRIVGSPVIDNPSFNGVANTMMYTVTVAVDGTAADRAHDAKVGFVSDDDYTTCTGTTAWKWSHSQRFDTTDTRSWTLYNFLPGTSYRYKVTIGTGGSARSRCGALTTTTASTPTVPANLAALNLVYDWGGASHPADTRYVLVETEDCGTSGSSPTRQYVVVLDPVNEAIVWYLDIAAASNVRGGTSTGYRYQPGTTDTSGRIVMTVDRRYVFEWAFDGTVINSHDFGAGDECAGTTGSEGPCPHHDVFKSDDTGRTYVLASKRTTVDATGTAWDRSCGTDAYFVDDGFDVLSSRSDDVTAEHSVMSDYGYDPTVDGGPHEAELSSRPAACEADTWNNIFDPAWGTIDWTHANAIGASKYGASEMVDVSLKEWNQVLRFNANTGELVWSLSSESGWSDFGTIGKAAGIVGDADFAGQHEVHPVGPDTLLIFDNHGAGGGARVLELALDTSAWSATIEKSWAMVDAGGRALGCGIEGSGELVPDSADGHVLGDCPAKYTISELDDPTGNTGTPALSISLPDGTHDAFCTAGGPTSRASIMGWQRAFPLAHVGEF